MRDFVGSLERSGDAGRMSEALGDAGGRLEEATLDPLYAELCAAPDVWQRALACLQFQMTAATFNRRLRGSHLREVRDGTLVVVVRDPASIPWLTNRLAGTVRRALEAVAGLPLEVEYVVNDE